MKSINIKEFNLLNSKKRNSCEIWKMKFFTKEQIDSLINVNKIIKQTETIKESFKNLKIEPINIEVEFTVFQKSFFDHYDEKVQLYRDHFNIIKEINYWYIPWTPRIYKDWITEIKVVKDYENNNNILFKEIEKMNDNKINWNKYSIEFISNIYSTSINFDINNDYKKWYWFINVNFLNDLYKEVRKKLNSFLKEEPVLTILVTKKDNDNEDWKKTNTPIPFKSLDLYPIKKVEKEPVLV